MRELAKLKGTPESELPRQLIALQEQIAEQQQRLYGASSEKRSAADARKARDKSKTPRKGHGPTSQPDLPIVEQVHSLDEADQQCVKCGGHLTEMTGQFEESEEVDVVEVSYRIIKHKKTRYRCGCNGHVETALGPTKLIVGGRYSLDFAI